MMAGVAPAADAIAQVSAQTRPTVLEQDRFYSDFLCSHVTVQTNSQTRDDER